MLRHDWALFWIVGSIALAVWWAVSFFSREARLERRRRKSHARLVKKTNRPMVRFSVRDPDRKKR